MDTKRALDILIAVAICETKRKNRFECVECPLHTYDEECNSTCELWTDKELDEAIRLLKTVKVLEPNPADPEVFLPIRKPIEAPEGPPIVKPIPSSEDILPTKTTMSNEPYANAPTCLGSLPPQTNLIYDFGGFKVPKPVAKINLCGCLEVTITDTAKGFIKPTPEQIKNLKEMLCIDVELLEEEQ